MDPQQPTPLPTQPQQYNKALWLLGALVCILGVAFTAAYVYMQPTAHPPVATDTSAVTPSPTNTQPQGTLTVSEILHDSVNTTPIAVTWLTAREELPNLHLVTYTDYEEKPVPDTAVKYYRLGRTASGEDVIAILEPCIEMCFEDPSPFILLRRSDNAYTFLLQNLIYGQRLRYEDTKNTKPFGGTWASSVSFDDTLVLRDIIASDYTLTSGTITNRLLAQGGVRFAETSPELQKEPIPELDGFSRVYYTFDVPFKDTYPGMRLERLYKLLPAGLTSEYYLEPAFYTQYGGTPDITWSDGTKNASTYRVDGVAGCGGHGAVSVDTTPAPANPLASGTTASGESVYSLSREHPMLAAFYKASGGKQFTWDAEKKENVERPFTLDDFARVHGVFTYTDILGRSVVFSNSDYGPQAECGKPVIYLYPERDTQVSVKVGADVTVSEPAYRRGDGAGWTALAKPSGELFVAGKPYPYLFWDGTGHGAYPSITKGVIVPTDEAEATLRTQLAQLGLRGREVSDFLEFWLPRMPHTPYVRLSWLGTREMDELAPLAITPRPDTVIRVFLDFAGVEAPYLLEPQTLTSRPRTGFTIVEWGGLLRE